MAYFDGLKEVILGVGLIVPKPQVFQEHIQYLLCLTTPQEIIILGVSFTGTAIYLSSMNLSTCIYLSIYLASVTDTYGEMHLLPDPLFTLPSDNTSMLCVIGTGTGRIFMAGKDGCLYETLYQVRRGETYQIRSD